MRDIRHVPDVAKALRDATTLIVAAPASALADRWHQRVLGKALAVRLDALAADQKTGAMGTVVTAITNDAPRCLALALLPDAGSRHNTPTRVESILQCMRSFRYLPGNAVVVAYADDSEHLRGILAGIWRAHPLYQRKTGSEARGKDVLSIYVADSSGERVPVDALARETMDAGRWAANLVDTPCEDLSPADFVRETRKLLRGLPGLRLREIVGDALLTQGLGGIHAVGRAASVPPRLLIADYRPARSKRTVALVGKGVVFDTGGLHLKARGFMETMKADMGGAAAVAGALRVLVATKFPHRVVALMALVENSIGPDSFRPDDILTLHSGHTVEINNTDAEGRLLLGDAVSFAARELDADVILDAATLTGAQSIATGIRHAAVMSNRAGLETLAVDAGRRTGDLTFPLPFAPEFFQSEFQSPLADMRNSVASRSNAQSSCAGQFIYSHIDDLNVPWLHIDLAGPAHRNDRGTGFGVALLSEMARSLTSEHLEA